MNLFKFLLIMMALLPGLASAVQEGHGGSWSEGDLKHFLSKLVPYLESPEGKSLFPEVASYDHLHPLEKIEQIAQNISPRLVDEPVYDEGGNQRDCISIAYPVRYFKCNRQALPLKPDESTATNLRSEYYGSLYRLVLHEVFVQAGLENPLSREIPSTYPLSSRLNVHLEMFPEWVPGTGDVAQAIDYRRFEWINMGSKISIPVDTMITDDKILLPAGVEVTIPNPRNPKLVDTVRITCDLFVRDWVYRSGYSNEGKYISGTLEFTVGDRTENYGCNGVTLIKSAENSTLLNGQKPLFVKDEKASTSLMCFKGRRYQKEFGGISVELVKRYFQAIGGNLIEMGPFPTWNTGNQIDLLHKANSPGICPGGEVSR